ncbi:methyl-accepting chemotaxis protein [Myxococcus xanthus DK 1622]|uniref:Methyl-accepting chemotaxis protein n=1 Tax=Myxococcus xanthus (strain DK1622) TaxID=246197 RepID=Q1CX08_MYXXD|nr:MULTISPECIES: methyl-accepting chemotaxis protein [Myxococcus]ABF87794.1 methyl-accepting chemotaxis protein [Myxococcus xanthus DK 1622]NOJ58082.1 methyl-accepting chemotaxis protein [Myxococcus xanthus]QPM79233.1 methyl-accepting chemotaxis protein [Myxococcus xanthus]QVW68311.1 methyl-accepting chemotaxis protein [Myxococcus xanthus DZ2]QZZ54554.1 Putative methyl-accepting chemotaxis protein YoaH [Myxococcus xanthus]
MSIGNRIALGFGLSLLMLLIVAGVSFQGANQLTTSTAGLLTAHENFRIIREVRALLMDAESGQRGFILTGDESYLVPYREAAVALQNDLSRLRDAMADHPNQRARLNRLEPIVTQRVNRLEEGIRLRRQEGLEAGAKFIQAGQGREVMLQVKQIIDEMLVAEQERWDEHATAARDMAQRILWVLGIGTLLGVVIVGGGSYIITRGITTPLRALMVGAEQLGRGKLEHRIDVKGQDETAQLARAFNDMAEKRQQNEVQLEKESEQREHTLRTVAEFVNQLAGASAEILSSTTEQVAGAQEQGSAVTETVSTIEEITKTSEEAAGRARAVSDSARHAEDVGRSGRRAVEEAVGAMGAVREQVESIASRILALAEQAQAIGDIITTVNDISEQTHMLALNASIEASRAGEHGRGFAVVASEVKALADQSKKATGQVRQILGQIQKATHGAVMTTEEGTKSVATATRVVSEAGANIQTLSDLLAQASLTAAQIAASANQQATGIGQIRQAMHDVNQATQQALISSRQTERAMQDLNGMGQKLKGLLGEYGR